MLMSGGSTFTNATSGQTYTAGTTPDVGPADVRLALINGWSEVQPQGPGTPGVPSISVNVFGVVGSSSADQTAAITSAIAQAAALGAALYFPPGIYIYSGAIANSVSWFGAGPSLVEIRKNTTLGAGAAITHNSVSNITITGITFTSPNTPTSAVNNAVNADMCLSFYTSSNINVLDCVFRNQYGVNVYFEYVTTGRIVNCRVYTCYKDGFAVDRGSSDVEVIDCLVEDGGDDCFPVVGYVGDSSRPTNITHIGCTVRGSKSANGFKHAGSVGCAIIGCKVDGTIPSSYGRSTAQQSCPALNILVDTSANTLGVEDLTVNGFQAINCGRGAAPFTSLIPAVQILGASGKTVRNIRLSNISIKNSASIGLTAEGSVAGGIINLSLDGINIIDTSDVNGYTATAGTAKFTGVNIRNTKDLTFRGSISDSGASGMAIDSSCTGYHDIELKSYRINKGAQTSAVRILDTVNSSSNITRLRAKLFVGEQTNASSGNAQFLNNCVLLQTKGITELMQIELDKSITAIPFASFPNSQTSVTITASPMTYTNSSTQKQLIQITPGTASGLTVARGQASNMGSTVSLAASSQVYLMTLAPNETITLSYTTAGTLAAATQPAEGL